MKTFDEFVLSWWNEYLENTTEETAKAIMENEFIGDEEAVDDYIPTPNCEAENCREWLSLQDDATRIYETFFGIEASKYYDNLPDTPTFLIDMFLQAARWFDCVDDTMPDFARDFCFEMASKAADYTEPKAYFEDLHKGGCQSGFVSMLIYNSDCKDIYINHIDDMEEYIEQIEENMGEPLKNRNRLPHYTFVCWVCFEELAFNIAQTLFPDEF